MCNTIFQYLTEAKTKEFFMVEELESSWWFIF